MALNPKTSLASRALALNAAFDILNSGHLLIYDGTQPVDADTALGAQVLGADLGLNATAFAAASAGSKVANAITQDSDANASINPATWGTLVVTSRATTGTMDFSVGTSGANMNLNTTNIVIHAAVSCSSLTITQAA